MAMEALWFEDFAAGGEWETEARALAGEDVDAFAALSGDRNPLHLDDDYARAAGFGGRIAHGVLGLAVATGLLNRLGLTRGTLVALLGVTWDFRRPVRPGDVLRARLRVAGTCETSRPDRGVVRLEARLVDQHGETAQDGELRLLVRRRG